MLHPAAVTRVNNFYAAVWMKHHYIKLNLKAIKQSEKKSKTNKQLKRGTSFNSQISVSSFLIALYVLYFCVLCFVEIE